MNSFPRGTDASVCWACLFSCNIENSNPIIVQTSPAAHCLSHQGQIQLAQLTPTPVAHRLCTDLAAHRSTQTSPEGADHIMVKHE